MPQWLRNQLERAFQSKNVRQIRLLNDCWLYYQSNMRGRPARSKPANE